jgi:TolB-like protein/Tfp pilus assembly protein PilF
LTLFAELRRRNVFRVAIAYAVAAWVILQIVDVVTPILELPAWAPKLIFVILAVGLVPVLVFSWVYELTPEGIRRESKVDQDRSVRRATGRKLNAVIIGTLAVAVALLLVERVLIDRTRHAGAETTAAVPEMTDEATEPAPSIAVLPFVNMSSDPEQEYFSDGITEEILNSLASVKELKVAGRTSSFAFKGQNEDLRRIGDALGVELILEGSVRKSGDNVRITAQLIQAADGFHLWSEAYDRKLTDVFAIQDEIAGEILAQLKSQLLTGTETVAEVHRTAPEVYDLYLRAKQRIYTRDRGNIETAIDELDEAIRLDASYAPAYAQRGIGVMLLSEQQYGDIPDDEANRRGKRFLEQALALDENHAEAWAGIGLFYANTPGQAELAIEPLTRALELNPNLIDASNWLQITLQSLGDYRGSMEILAELTEREPLYTPAISNAIQTFNSFSETAKIQQLLQRMQAFDPNSPNLLLARAINLMYSGNMGEGLKLMEQRRELGNMSGVAKVYLSVGLLQTMQFERAVTEGSQYLRPEALYETGRSEEAYELAYDLARSGYPGWLFRLFVWDGRHKEVVDFLEERWPSITAFANEVRGDDFGYGPMADVALSYAQLDDPERFQEAMSYLERHTANLREQGVDNAGFAWGLAVQHALNGEVDLALDSLERSAEQGASTNGKLIEKEPAFAALVDEPRLAALEARMRESLNRNRAIVGLPPVDGNYTLKATLAP